MREATIKILDDHNGEEADETVEFALDGYLYLTDLTGENAARLRADMQPWIDGAWDKKPLQRSKAKKRSHHAPEASRPLRRRATVAISAPSTPKKKRGGGAPRVLTPAEEQGVIDMRMAGKTTTQVASHYGVSTAKVYRVIQEHGIQLPSQHTKPSEVTRSLAITNPAVRRKIRNWARKKGYDVGVKGIISAEIQDQYKAAHNGKLT